MFGHFAEDQLKMVPLNFRAMIFGSSKCLASHSYSSLLQKMYIGKGWDYLFPISFAHPTRTNPFYGFCCLGSYIWWAQAVGLFCCGSGTCIEEYSPRRDEVNLITPELLKVSQVLVMPTSLRIPGDKWFHEVILIILIFVCLLLSFPVLILLL